MSIFLKTAIEAAKKAEKIILDCYSQNLKPDFKKDLTPVTQADINSEKIIIETIRSRFPTHGFLAEETGKSNKESEYLWIIDPIDGTKNFIRHIPFFATEIALMRNNEVIVGVSNAPKLKEMLYAEKDQGAYLDNQKIRVSDVDSLDQSFLSFGNLRYFKERNLENRLISLVDKVQQSRGYGDFWPLHLVAKGSIEIMIDAKMKIWDNAALKIIVEEAGGMMTDINGKPFDLKTTSSITTNKKLHEKIVKFFLEK